MGANAKVRATFPLQCMGTISNAPDPAYTGGLRATTGSDPNVAPYVDGDDICHAKHGQTDRPERREA